MLAAVISVVPVVYGTMPREKRCLAGAALSVFGSCFNQGLMCSGTKLYRKHHLVFLAMLMVYNYLMTIMYNTKMMAMLAAPGSGANENQKAGGRPAA